jgi:hypothetical protein
MSSINYTSNRRASSDSRLSLVIARLKIDLRNKSFSINPELALMLRKMRR